MAVTWPLVGRQEELAAIAEAMRSGQSSGAVLVGRAGVGKTRLAREALGLASKAGWSTEWTAASRALAAVPFGAFAGFLPSRARGDVQPIDLVRLAAAQLRERTESFKLALGVDDAHTLDEASAGFLHQIAASRSAFVVVTLRAGEPVHDAITSLWKDELAARVDIGELREEEVRELLERAFDGPVESGTLEKLYSTTQGNVLYLRELVAGGLESGALRRKEAVWTWQGPLAATRLVELVEARLRGLGTEQRVALETLAIAEPIGVPVLETLFEGPVVDELERAGLVSIESDRRRLQATLAHPLYAEVLREATPPHRARSINRRLADALQATGARRRDDLLRLATWRVEGGGEVDPKMLTEAALLAANTGHTVSSERLARAAVDAGGGFEASLSLAYSLDWQYRWQEADAICSSLQGQARSDSQRARLAATQARSRAWFVRDAGAGAEILAAAEGELEGDEWRTYLQSHRTLLLYYAGRPSEALPLSESVLSDPTASDEDIARALGSATIAWSMAGKADRSIAEIDSRADLLVRHVGADPAPLGLVLGARLVSHWVRGEPQAAYDLTQTVREASSGVRLALRAAFPLLLGRGALFLGRPRTASTWFREAIAVLREVDVGGFLPWCLAGEAHARALLGEPDEAAAALAEADRRPTVLEAIYKWDLELTRAYVSASGGDVASARSFCHRAANVAVSYGYSGCELLILPHLVAFGGAEEARERAAALLGVVDGPLVDAVHAYAEASISGSGPGLEQASSTFDAMGFELLAAEAAALASSMHTRAGRTASARRASATARSLLARCEGATTPALRGLDAAPTLTPREREIARLATEGLSNREIADRLVVSVRTVENHLHQAYTKLGVSGREELAVPLGLGTRTKPLAGAVD